MTIEKPQDKERKEKYTKHCPKCYKEFTEDKVFCDNKCGFFLGLRPEVVEYKTSPIDQYLHNTPLGLKAFRIELKDRVMHIGLVKNTEEYYKLNKSNAQ